jgi:nucleotide-binding universal stress UspA family protein
MKILVGTDFSPNAADAIKVAAALARRFNDGLHLVHATQPPLLEGGPDPLWDPLVTGLRDRMQLEVTALQAATPKATGSVEIGPADSVFKHLARPGQARLVVVSSVGRVALTRVLLGSTAERIAEAAAVPTLVTRTTAPFREWAAGQRPLRVFVACDFTLASDAALAFAGELAAHGPCDLSVGYVDDRTLDGAPDAPPAPATPAAWAATWRRDLGEKVAAMLGEHRVQLLVEAGVNNPAGTLIELAKATQADLLVVGTNQHHGLSRLWHRSTSRALLNDAPMSVACVPVAGHPPVPTNVPVLSRVLVTTDFSPVGNRAVVAACALLPNGGRLRLFHALTQQQSPMTALFGGGKRPTLSPGEHRRLLQSARKKLGALVPAAALQHGVTVEVVVEPVTHVAAAILRQAEQFGAHVICLSSHGRTGLAGAVFGSVAADVVAQSHRPVHLVRLSPT